jgi:ribulose-5-phosphate 4-epimerase/fuculose-1-phosphate aldolase
MVDPDALAAAHAHSLHGKAFSSLHRLLDPIAKDDCRFYNDHGRYDDFGGVVTDREKGAQIGKALGSYKAVLLANHGILTVAEAAWWFIAMERSCQAQFLALAAGEPIADRSRDGHDGAPPDGLPASRLVPAATDARRDPRRVTGLLD